MEPDFFFIFFFWREPGPAVFNAFSVVFSRIFSGFPLAAFFPLL